MKRMLLLLVVPGLLALAACGSETNTATDTQAVSAEVTATSYDTLDDLRDAFVRGGFSCSPYTPVQPGFDSQGSATCGDNAVLMIFDDTSQQDRWAAMTAEREQAVLMGPNWMVSTYPYDTLPDAQAVLGGEIINQP